jgi:methylaspartate ammonia-lyase
VREEDVNGDGLPDLVCEFRTSQAGFHLDDTEAVLEGATTDGGAMVGANPILPVTSQ